MVCPINTRGVPSDGMANASDFASVPKYDPYVAVDIKVMGSKQVKRRQDGKEYNILICMDQNGREVSLFDWALDKRGESWYVLKKHLIQALDTAK